MPGGERAHHDEQQVGDDSVGLRVCDVLFRTLRVPYDVFVDDRQEAKVVVEEDVKVSRYRLRATASSGKVREKQWIRQAVATCTGMHAQVQGGHR